MTEVVTNVHFNAVAACGRMAHASAHILGYYQCGMLRSNAVPHYRAD
jgi:hypothetical protein